MSGIIRVLIVLILAFIVVSAFIIACSKSENEDNKPEIVGCNSVKYKGYTYTNLGCAPGIASFNVTTTQGGHTASFHITCSGGCIATVSVGSGENMPLLGP